MHTAQQRHAEDKRQLMEEIGHTTEEIRQTSERLCEMAATTQQMSRVAVRMSQVARQKRRETLNGERKTYKITQYHRQDGGEAGRLNAV